MEPQSKDIPLLTFNSLYNLLREEKKTKKLNKIDPHFYTALEKYTKEKTQEIEKLKSENIEKAKKEKLTLKNSIRITQEILNLRFMKISEIAIKQELFGEDSQANVNILDEEKEFAMDVKKSAKKIKPKFV